MNCEILQFGAKLLLLILIIFIWLYLFNMVLRSNIFDINNIKATQYTVAIFWKNITSFFNRNHPVSKSVRSFDYFYCVTTYLLLQSHNRRSSLGPTHVSSNPILKTCIYEKHLRTQQKSDECLIADLLDNARSNTNCVVQIDLLKYSTVETTLL